MKIDRISCPELLPLYSSYKVTARAPEGGGDYDQVTISETAISFSKVLASATARAKIRTPEESARIAEITRQVQEGTYLVDARAVADSILHQVYWSAD